MILVAKLGLHDFQKRFDADHAHWWEIFWSKWFKYVKMVVVVDEIICSGSHIAVHEFVVVRVVLDEIPFVRNDFMLNIGSVLKTFQNIRCDVWGASY